MRNQASTAYLAMGPKDTKLNRVSVPTETHGNPISVDLCELVVAAFTRSGYSGKQAAALLEMQPSAFTRSFSANYPDQNTAMKRLGSVPVEVLKEFAALLAERVGLSAGIDSAKVEASVRVADAVLNLMTVAKR